MESTALASMLVGPSRRHMQSRSLYAAAQARRIRRGEELFIDYGPLFFKDQAGTSVNAEGPLFAST